MSYLIEGPSGMVQAPEVGDEGRLLAGVAKPEALLPVDGSLLALVASELDGLQENLATALSIAVAESFSTEERRVALESYLTEMERLGAAAGVTGLHALYVVLEWVAGSVRALREQGLKQAQHDALSLLPGLVLLYLHDPGDASICQGITDLLSGDIWDAPMSAADAAALARDLAAIKVVRDAAMAPSRPSHAQAEDVLLAVPPDINPELLNSLLQELPRQVADFSAAVQHMTAGVGGREELEAAKRAAHTLKGAAHTVGISGIANLTHHLEDILIAYSNQKALPQGPAAQMLTRASDCLEAMSETVLGVGAAPSDAQAVLQEVLDWAHRIDREGVGQSLQAAAGQFKAGSVDSTDVAIAAPAVPRQVPAEIDASVAMVRVPATLIEDLLRLLGETIVSGSQVQERLRSVSQQSGAIQAQNRALLHLTGELENLVDVRGVLRSSQVAGNEDFDPLEFEHYSELHTVTRRLIESAHDFHELSGSIEGNLTVLDELVEVQRRLHMETQTAVMRTRMIPINSIVPRLQRSLRQTCRLLDKKATLSITGEETLVDGNILNELMDPLMHILRNAVDHGIEAPPLRAALGKAEEGRIEFAFAREGNHVVARCRDDGAGLDLERIRISATEKGLLEAGRDPTEEELTRLILAPGFSTRHQATEVSGRGIGMDVVNSSILQLKGSLALRSVKGQGLQVELRVPAVLISTHAVLARSGNKVIAVSSHGIQDIQYVESQNIKRLGDETVCYTGDAVLQVTEFEQLLGLAQDRRGRRRGGITLLKVQLDSGEVRGVQVQEILESRDLIVKDLGRYVPKISGIAGTAVLGDGSVVPVVDLPEFMRSSSSRVAGHGQAGVRTLTGEEETASVRLTALVVDDSLSARRVTAQLMKDAGFEVRTAIDGVEAVSLLSKWTPSILLVDMEMPRMNGLELAAHVRGREATARLPVIMITSRSTEKHRQQAQAAGVDAYLTKPFNDDELLRHVTQLTSRRAH